MRLLVSDLVISHTNYATRIKKINSYIKVEDISNYISNITKCDLCNP